METLIVWLDRINECYILLNSLHWNELLGFIMVLLFDFINDALISVWSHWHLPHTYCIHPPYLFNGWLIYSGRWAFMIWWQWVYIVILYICCDSLVIYFVRLPAACMDCMGEFGFLNPDGFIRFNYGNPSLFNEFDHPIYAFHSKENGILLVGNHGPDMLPVIENDLSPYLVYNRGTFYSAPPAELILLGRAYNCSPNLPTVGDAISELGLEGYVDVGFKDDFQFWIQFEKEADYAFVFLKGKIDLEDDGNFHFVKWAADLPFYRDNPIVPVWVHFFQLHASFLNLDDLCGICNRFGRPLWAILDDPGNCLAKVLVEIDTSASISTVFCFHRNTETFWCRVGFEDVPQFCVGCHKFYTHLGRCHLRRRALGYRTSFGLEISASSPPSTLDSLVEPLVDLRIAGPTDD